MHKNSNKFITFRLDKVPYLPKTLSHIMFNSNKFVNFISNRYNNLV